jgi:hypothetical protein
MKSRLGDKVRIQHINDSSEKYITIQTAEKMRTFLWFIEALFL